MRQRPCQSQTSSQFFGSRPVAADPACEWLVTNRLGSYAMGTVGRRPARKYHGLLTVRDGGTGEPWHVLADVAESFSFGQTARRLTAPARFRYAPLPWWTYEVAPVTVERTVALDPEQDVVEVAYRLRGAKGRLEMVLEPRWTCRPWHSLTVANPALDGRVRPGGGGWSLCPYAGMPAIAFALHGAEATWESATDWLRDVDYPVEVDRGYAGREDHFVCGHLRIALAGDGIVRLRVAVHAVEDRARAMAAGTGAERPWPRSGRGAKDSTRLGRAGQAYLTRRPETGAGVVAGYPWFGEWGRDSMIALAGLTWAADRGAWAGEILATYARRMRNGRLPNVFQAGADNMDAVDASLLFARAVGELAERRGWAFAAPLLPSVVAVVDGFARGADERVRVADDGGLWIEPGPWALTWMDAKVDGRPVTPRHGFAVEINALFLEALDLVLRWADHVGDKDLRRRWQPVAAAGVAGFADRFWHAAGGYLSDTHDGSASDGVLRPNQLWALASPLDLLAPGRAKQALAAVRERLRTPVGLRTLDPADCAYRGRYSGDQRERDRAYHQGTVWPWLLRSLTCSAN